MLLYTQQFLLMRAAAASNIWAATLVSAWGKEMWRKAAATAQEFLFKRSRNCAIHVFNLRHAVRILALYQGERWGENKGRGSYSNGKRWKHQCVHSQIPFLTLLCSIIPREKTSVIKEVISYVMGRRLFQPQFSNERQVNSNCLQNTAGLFGKPA